MDDAGFFDRRLGLAMSGEMRPTCACALCMADSWQFLARFDQKPEGETDFGFNPYCRELWRCAGCGHIVNRHLFDMARIYEGAYRDATYAGRIRATYDKIMALSPDKSDNKGRVTRLIGFLGEIGADLEGDLLDIGTGLAVFPAAMKEAGWRVDALDPDPAAAAFSTEVVGVNGLSVDFMRLCVSKRYDLISLNKVLEHVPSMADMLARTLQFLKPGGCVYIEVPDGAAAIEQSAAREEFFVEHYCAFSPRSMEYLINQAGLKNLHQERLVEPSGKYTLRAFLTHP